jgi:hypothetical protein
MKRSTKGLLGIRFFENKFNNPYGSPRYGFPSAINSWRNERQISFPFVSKKNSNLFLLDKSDHRHLVWNHCVILQRHKIPHSVIVVNTFSRCSRFEHLAVFNNRIHGAVLVYRVSTAYIYMKVCRKKTIYKEHLSFPFRSTTTISGHLIH